MKIAAFTFSQIDLNNNKKSEYLVPTLKSQYHCTCDDRLRILILYYYAKFTKDEIALQLNLRVRQIKYASTHRYPLTPQKSTLAVDLSLVL